MTTLTLALFGGFEARVGSGPALILPAKSQALLAYIAVCPQSHTREKIATLLWGDTAEPQARQSLRQALAGLRRTLGGVPVLQDEGQTLAVQPGSVEIDVTTFEQSIAEGTPDGLERAMALYRGDLLAGVVTNEAPFEEWLIPERERLRELALEGAARLLAHQMKTDATEPAIRTAGRLLGLDPSQEAVHRALMRLYSQQGRRAAALRQYQTCMTVLQKELGVEPEPETKRLYLEILQRAAPASRRASRGRADGAPASRPALPASEAPLIGREAELATLRQRWRVAERGNGQVVLITGEAGIGKSRLVEELVAEAVAHGARVLLGRAHETEQILPFQPWVDAVRAGHALDRVGDTPTGSAARAHLARLFPELGARNARPPITGESYLRLFESIEELIGELARTEPVLVVLEDLQWADEMSLRLVSFLARRLGPRPVLLLGTAREEELPDARALQQLLAELGSLPHAEQLNLRSLLAPGTAALVRALARAGSNDARLADVTDRVWALSEGNPLVIVETMRTLGEGRLPEPTGVELPQRVRAMIAARLDRLSPRAQELARVASVFTHDVEFPVLQRAGGLGRRETAEAVEELVRRRILDAVDERFDFTHARIREAVYQGLLAPRRQVLHAAIGEALEAVYAGRLDETYDRLAYHFSRADEPARALTYLVHRADEVARSYALEDAARVLRDALTHAQRLEPGERDRRCLDVVYSLTHVLSLLGRSGEARDLVEAQQTRVDRLADPAVSGLHYFWLATIYSALADVERALPTARRALEHAARAGDRATMGKANYVLSYECYILGRAREGIAHGRQAVALLERTDGRWWLGHAYRSLAMNLLHLGDFTAALEAAEQTRVEGEALGDTRLQALGAATAGRIASLIGDGDTAIAATRNAVDLARDPISRAYTVGSLGVAYHERDEPAPGIPFLEDAIGQLERLAGVGGYRYRQLDGYFTAVLAESYALVGDVARARILADKARQIAADGGWQVAVGYAERALGQLARVEGDIDRAEQHFRRALDLFRDVETNFQVARIQLLLAEVSHARGDRDGARAWLTEAHGAFETMRVPRYVERAGRLAKELGFSLD